MGAGIACMLQNSYLETSFLINYEFERRLIGPLLFIFCLRQQEEKFLKRNSEDSVRIL
jgi:hypothetical protein